MIPIDSVYKLNASTQATPFSALLIFGYPSARMVFGFTIGSLDLLSFILSVAPGFLQFSKEKITGGSITPLNPEQISWYRPYTYFASIGYCHPSTTFNWTCGERLLFLLLCGIGRVINCFVLRVIAHCAANKDFIQTASGGDGGSVQFCKLHR